MRIRCPTSAAAMAMPSYERQVTTAVQHGAVYLSGPSCVLPDTTCWPQTSIEKKHARQYGRLVRALEKLTSRLELQQEDDLKAERMRCQAERERESNEFNAELLERLSCRKPGKEARFCVLGSPPNTKSATFTIADGGGRGVDTARGQAGYPLLFNYYWQLVVVIQAVSGQ